MTKSGAPQRAARVIRISQDRDGVSESPETQRQILEKLEANLGWHVEHEFVVRNVSARSKRWAAELADLCGRIESGDCDGVLAVDLDRLVRRVKDITQVIEVCEPAGTPIVLASGELDTSTSDGVMRAQMLAVLAEYEARKKGERQRRRNERMAREKGQRHSGGRRPFGYERDGVTVRKDEAKIIREIARRFIKGESLRKLADDLNARGIKPSSSDEWKVTTLRSLLGSARIAGLRTYRDEIVGRAEWKPIIDEETHAELIERLGDVRRAQTGRPETALLSNILRCSQCGCGLVAGTRSNGQRRYLCYTSPGHKGCGKIAIAAERTEAYVGELVLAALDDSDIPRPLPSRNRDAELADIAEREAAISRMYAMGELGQHEWTEARKALKERKRALGNLQPSRKPPAVLYGRKSVRRAWPTLSQAERREVISFVVEAIDVLPASAPRWDSSRLADPLWRI